MAQALRAIDLRPRQALTGNDERAALSPDEELVAYAIQPQVYHAGPGRGSGVFLPSGAPGLVERSEVWIVDLGGTHRQAVTPEADGWGSSWGPRWSPDGRRLAFYSDRGGAPQFWLWDRETGGARLVCTEAAAMRFGFEGMHWLPDGSGLVAKLRAPGWTPPSVAVEEEQSAEWGRAGRTADTPGTARPARDVWLSPVDERSFLRRDEGQRSIDWSRGDLAVIDAHTGSARRLTAESAPYGTAVSPDGRHVAAMCRRDEPGLVSANVARYDLRAFALDGSRRAVLAERVPQAFGCDFSWSPAGDAVAYIALGDAPGQPGRLVVVSLDGRTLATWGGGELDLGYDEGFAPPLWSADGQALYCYGGGTIYRVDLAGGEIHEVAEGLSGSVVGMVKSFGRGTAPDFGHPGTVVAVTRRAGLQGLFRVGGGEPVPLIQDRGQNLIDLLILGDPGERRLVGPCTGASRTRDLYAFDLRTGDERRLTALNPHLEAVPRPPSRPVRSQGPDGAERRATVWLPATYEPGRRYPAVVTGGLGAETPLLTARGYAVVAHSGRPAGGLEPADAYARRFLDALDAAVEDGYADPDRAGLFGHSQGGYEVCCAVTRTGRFRAAVASAPFTDLVSFALRVRGNRLVWSSFVEGGAVQMRAAPWAAPERYVANSPVFHLHRVTTPLLFLHGTGDGLSISQSEEMYGGLLRQGKVAALVRYHGEGHAPYLQWSDENYEDYWARIVGWFDQWLAAPRA